MRNTSRFVIETLIGPHCDDDRCEDWEALERIDGTVTLQPVTYTSYTEADAELEDHLCNLRNAAMDYDRADYRIREIRYKLNPDFARCDNCGTEYEVCELDFIENFSERVYPGEEVPAGQCTDDSCGACCFLIEVQDDSAETLDPVRDTSKELTFIADAARDFADLMEADYEDSQDPDTIADVQKIRAALGSLGL